MTDSMFLCNCMAKLINKWKCNGWRNCKGNIVANKYMLEQLDSRVKAMNFVKFVSYSFISQCYNEQKSSLFALVKLLYLCFNCIDLRSRT